MEGLLVWHNWVAQLICGERRTNVKWNDFRSWASYCQQLIPTVSLLTVLENLPSLLWIVSVEIFFADNVGKQLNIEQILPRSKSASVLTYLKYPNWLQKGEPLVQTSDLQKDLHSLQNDQRKASVDLLEIFWVSWVHRLHTEVKDTMEELDGLSMNSQLWFTFEVNGCGIIPLS